MAYQQKKGDKISLEIINDKSNLPPDASDKEIKMLLKVFKDLDDEKKGYLNKGQFINALELLDLFGPLVKEKFNDLFYKRANLTPDKLLSQDEFLKVRFEIFSH